MKKIWDKGLLYKGFKIVPYCPRCGTPLSSHEVAQGYKDVKERSAIARFKVKDEDAYILAWTTTPWTLPSNVALCVNPDENVCEGAKTGTELYYLAEALCDTVLEGEHLRCWSGIRERTWNTRSTSRCSTAPWTSAAVSRKRRFTSSVRLCNADRRYRRGSYRPGVR